MEPIIETKQEEEEQIAISPRFYESPKNQTEKVRIIIFVDNRFFSASQG